MRTIKPASPAARRQVLVVLLAINSGATDGIGFLALGGVFTSVMTGNMVLLGLSAGQGDGDRAWHLLVAIGCYIAGCGLGARLAGTPQPGDADWPRPVTRALAVEAVAIGLTAIGWWVTGGRPDSAEQLGLLAVAAVALGIQSSAVQRFGVSGLSTTYLTGTLTTTVVHLISGQPIRAVGRNLQLLGGLIGGAALAGLLIHYARPAAPALQLLCLGIVLATATVTAKSRERHPVHSLETVGETMRAEVGIDADQ